MNRLAQVAIATAVGVGLLGGVVGTSLAADPTPTPTNYQNIFVGKVAKILGIDQQKVDNAFDQARTEMIDEAVKAGRISKEQADWMKQRLQQGGFGPDGGPGFGSRGGRMGGKFGRPWQGTPVPAPSR